MLQAAPPQEVPVAESAIHAPAIPNPLSQEWVTREMLDSCVTALNALRGGPGDGNIPRGVDAKGTYFEERVVAVRKIPAYSAKSLEEIYDLAFAFRRMTPVQVRATIKKVLSEQNQRALDREDRLERSDILS